jgi:hypothetical protein
LDPHITTSGESTVAVAPDARSLRMVFTPELSGSPAVAVAGRRQPTATRTVEGILGRAGDEAAAE